MEKQRTLVTKILTSPKMLNYLGWLVKLSTNKDETIRSVLRVLATNQEIPLAQKDILRNTIRTWYRANVGDRKFFADSDLHRPTPRVYRKKESKWVGLVLTFSN